MRHRNDDPTRDPWEPELERRRDDTDESRNFETVVSDVGADYDAGFDEDLNPLDETDINEHGSER